MRDYILILAVLIGLGATFFNPFSGVLLWTWISIQNPHEEVYSFARTLQLNLVTAIVTILVWLLSRERKAPPSAFLVWIMLIFLAWATFNSFFAFSPDWSWPYWDRTWKIFALGMLITVLATNAVRIHAIIWTVVLSLFYYGVKGGIFTILKGGHYDVFGPPHSIIGDNNQLALALLMSLPLANYLHQQSANRFVKAGLIGGMALTLASIVGSYSRGAYLALGVLAAVWLFRSRRKFLYLSFATVGIFLVVYFMPQSFWDRLQTIQTADTDASFQGRLMAWQVAYRYATDHFPFGAGFYGPQLAQIFNAYFPGETAHAAHSIYFQVLGEHGFIGLFLYLLIIVGAFVKSFALIRRARRHPELEWVGELARMIQLSLVAFCVGGAALSMAYYDVFIICVALLVSLDELTSVAPHPLALHLPLAFAPNSPQASQALEPSLSGAPSSIHAPPSMDSDSRMP